MEENGNNNSNNKFGDLIAELRSKKNMTQKELGEKLLVSDKTISRWENGGSLPDMEMLHEISKFFKVSLMELAILRVASKDGNEEIVQNIIKEFNRKDTQKKRIIKIISIIALVIITFLIATLIFTSSYNKFKVYNVIIKSNDIYPRYGEYVETKIKDSLYLNSIAIRNYEENPNDTISVDLYYIESDKEYLLHSYSSLDNIRLVNYDSYTPIDNLSKYFDSLYIRVTIIDSKNNVKEYTGKLEFVLDFSNNKIYNNEERLLNTSGINLSQDEIKKILLDNGFEEIYDDTLSKNKNNFKIKYIGTSNKFNYDYINNKLDYRYIYDINRNKLKVHVFDENNIEIENYTYDVTNDKVIECITGKCNSYKEAMDILNKNLLYLFY